MAMRMGAFLPQLVMAQDREKPWADQLSGTVLFADVSGFTHMSEVLSVLGAEGAEILTEILNRYFAGMIGIVHSQGGQVLKFGGDAILCFFPERVAPQRARRAQNKGRKEEEIAGNQSLLSAVASAQRMQEAMSRFQRIKTPVKKFALQMKIGIAEGEVLLAGVGDPSVRCDYVFAGEPVDVVSEAEHHARAGDIVVCCNRTRSCEKAECIERGFCRLPGDCGLRNANFKIVHSKTRNPKSPNSSPYLIEEIHGMVSAGYTRYVGSLQAVVPVFLQFSGFLYSARAFDLQRFHEFFSLVMRITHQYAGRLNRISMGDKGSTFLILFGAPRTLERKEEMACQWALDLRSNVRKQFPQIDIKMGINTGRVFAGIVGGAGRFEYTVMGDAVNFAARLMQAAEPGQIFVSADLHAAATGHFSFASLGAMQFKGKTHPQDVFALKERRSRFAATVKTEEVFAGRHAEINMLRGHLEAATQGSPRMVLIEGDAGIGKTQLASQLLDKARHDGWTILSTAGEAARQAHAYHPWPTVFSSHLFGGKKPRIQDLRKLLKRSSFEDFLPWHAEFLGLKATPGNKKLAGYDEETKKNLLNHQLSVLLLGGDVAMGGPKLRRRISGVLIFLDDLHWFDTLSLELLLAVLNHLKHLRVMILGATRPNWKKEKFVNRSTCHYLNLAEMDRATVGELAREVLAGPVRDNLIDFLYNQAQGNPFFTRQVLVHLRDNNLISTRLGEWVLNRETELQKKLTGPDIIVTQAGRLSAAEKIHLQTAACIGPIFSTSVLQTALGKHYRQDTFESLCSVGYFRPMPDGRAAFPHALIQETLYSTLPNRMRKQNHQQIAVAIESLYSDGLSQHYPELANHFFFAGVHSKAIDYSVAAGNELYDNLSYPEACHFLQRSYDLLKHTSTSTKVDVGLRLGRAFVRTGRVQEALRVARKLLKLTTRRRSRDEYYLARILELEAMRRLGTYTYVPSTKLSLDNSKNLPGGAIVQFTYSLAVAAYSRGDFDAATKLFMTLLRSARSKSDMDIVLSSYMQLAGMNSVRGDFEGALRMLSKAADLVERRNNPYQALRVHIERANILQDSGQFDNARAVYLGLLQSAEGCGDTYLTAIILVNLGRLETNSSNREKAGKYLEESVKIFSATGVLNGRAQALLYMGILSFYESRFEDAYRHYLESVRIFERANEMVHACWGYYNLAEVLEKLGRMKEAREWHDKGIRSFRPEDDPNLAQKYRELGELLAGNHGDTKERR